MGTIKKIEGYAMQENKSQGTRLNKVLSDAGVCSRREADVMIEKGRVRVDGKVATVGMRIVEGQEVLFDLRPLAKKPHKIYIILNKPTGVVCTTDRREPGNVLDFLDHESRIFPIGRLDKDSQGLLLLTSDGDIVNAVLRAEGGHEKEYEVTIDRPVTDAFLKEMANGVKLGGVMTKKCKMTKIGRQAFRIVLTQGLNRQIRRMCEACGVHVLTLTRIRFLHIVLGHLKPGAWRNLSKGELDELLKRARQGRGE